MPDVNMMLNISISEVKKEIELCFTIFYKFKIMYNKTGILGDTHWQVEGEIIWSPVETKVDTDTHVHFMYLFFINITAI
jgi:hypothetical protein